jgi:hypothetical protein
MEERAITKAFTFCATSWFSDFKTKKYYLAIFVISLISMLIAYSILGSLFSEIAKILSGTPSMEQAIVFMSSFIGAMISITFISFLIGFFELAIVYMTNARALELKKYNPIKINLMNYFLLIVLGIVQIIAAIFSIMNPKFLLILAGGIIAILVGGVLSFFIGPFGGLIVLLGILAIIAYFFVIIYNLVRLAFSGIAFIEEKRDIMSALKESWKKTDGQFWEVFIALFIFGLVIIGVTYMAGVPASAYTTLYVGTNNTATDEFSAIVGLFNDPIYLVLSGLTLIAGAWATIAQSFYMVSIYGSLTNRKEKNVSEKKSKVVKKKAKKVLSKKKKK